MKSSPLNAKKTKNKKKVKSILKAHLTGDAPGHRDHKEQARNPLVSHVGRYPERSSDRTNASETVACRVPRRSNLSGV